MTGLVLDGWQDDRASFGGLAAWQGWLRRVGRMTGLASEGWQDDRAGFGGLAA